MRGMYLARPSSLAEPICSKPDAPLMQSAKTRSRKKHTAQGPLKHVQLLASGTILREALAAAQLLENDWNIAADVWSVTSFTELRRSGLEIERLNRLQLAESAELSWVEQCLCSRSGPVIAVTDYVRAVPDLIRTWVPRRYVTLGTDGLGRSDTRANLRRWFEVDRTSIALAAINALADDGMIAKMTRHAFLTRYGYRPPIEPPWADGRGVPQGRIPA